MDFIKAQLDRIQQQLAGLSATQKMLTATLVAIMAITVIWWGKYAGDSEVIPLLNQTFSDEEMGRMQDVLSGRGIHAEAVGGKLMIRSDLRMDALSALTFAKAMPKITDDGFKDVLSQSTPWNSESKDNRLWNRAKQQFLSRIISNIPDVASADVIIDPESHRGIGSGDITPTASVNITMVPGKGSSQNLVDAAAELLKGAQAGLTLDHVTVVVNGTPQRIHDPERDELASAGDAFEMRQRREAYEVGRVKTHYQYIPKMQVTVTVELNSTSTQTDKREVDAKGVVSKPTRTSEDTEESNTPTATSGEGGVVPNTALTPTPAASAPSQVQTHTHTESEMENVIPETHITSRTPAGDAKVVGASVSIPISYFVTEFKAHNPTISAPTPTQLDPYITLREKDLRKSIADMLVMADPDKLAMDTWPDVGEETAPPQLAPATTMANMTGFVGMHFKELALGGLAVMSLFMATMMVRKSTPVVVPAVQSQPAQVSPQMLAGETLVGEAPGSGATLDGMELNEDTIKSQQMVDQVSTLVRENPDAAASLVKRWLNRT